MDSHAFDGLIATSSTRWGRAYRVTVSPTLVRAVIAQESSFDTSVVRREPDGRISRGLMQVLESTARELGLSAPMRLHEPAIGIDYGVKYLAQKLATYHGDMVRAVAAYNAGSARLTSSGAFVNQGYVNRVLGFFRAFGGVVEGVSAALLVAVVALFMFRRRARKVHA